MEENNNKTDKHSEINDEVISRAIVGDPSDLVLIYDSYARYIDRYYYSSVGNAADEEGLTARTFMAMMRLSYYRHRGYFPAGVFRIAHNKIMDFFSETEARFN